MTILERVGSVLRLYQCWIVPVLDCTRAEIVPTSKFLRLVQNLVYSARLLILIKINTDPALSLSLDTLIFIIQCFR